MTREQKVKIPREAKVVSVTWGDMYEMVLELKKFPNEVRASRVKDIMCDRFGGYDVPLSYQLCEWSRQQKAMYQPTDVQKTYKVYEFAC